MSAVTWLAIAGGAVAPGLMAFGLFVWADAWTYSPLALNAFKCTLGSALFGVVGLMVGYSAGGRYQRQANELGVHRYEPVA